MPQDFFNIKKYNGNPLIRILYCILGYQKTALNKIDRATLKKIFSLYDYLSKDFNIIQQYHYKMKNKY